jgi:hypothetical protein
MQRQAAGEIRELRAEDRAAAMQPRLQGLIRHM